jgi:drug/metabolite transporter (DMT)-like permease
MSRRGWFLFVSMCVIWGLPYLFIKVALDHVTPGTLVFLRTGLAALILVPVAWSRGQLAAVLPSWRPLLAFAVVEIMVPWWLISDAETKLSSSVTGLLVAGVPLVGACIARLTPHSEAVNRTQLIGLLVGILGVGALVGLDFGDLNLLAVGEMLLVLVGYSVGPIILSRSLAHLPSLGVIALSLVASALAYVPFVVVQPPELTPKVVGSVVVLSVVCTAAAFILFFELIATIGPVRATVIAQVNPAVAVLLGVVVLSESLTAGMLVGFPLIIGGSVLAARRARTPDPHTVEDAPTNPVPA